VQTVFQLNQKTNKMILILKNGTVIQLTDAEYKSIMDGIKKGASYTFCLLGGKETIIVAIGDISIICDKSKVVPFGWRDRCKRWLGYYK